MKRKMTAAEVQALLDDNLFQPEDDDSEYVEVQLPNWMIEILLLLFPNWSPEQSMEFLCREFLENNKRTKLN
ncbi:MAG: hypothetical protein AAF960_22520 [Bacteroidota bacterium]